MDALGQAVSGERRLETALRDLRALLADPADLERRARHFVETLARATAAALLLEHAPSAVAEPFIAGRLDGTFCHTYGAGTRSDEHTSELQSLMRNSYAAFCLKQTTNQKQRSHHIMHKNQSDDN